MINRETLVVGTGDYQLSLTKLTGKKIADVTFYISTQFDGYTLKLCQLIFEDGSEMGFEGEHDFPYLTDYKKWPIPNIDDGTLQQIYEQGDDYKDEIAGDE